MQSSVKENPSGLGAVIPNESQDIMQINFLLTIGKIILYRTNFPRFFSFIDEHLQGDQIGDKIEHLLMRTNV